MSAGVPTVWLGCSQHLDEQPELDRSSACRRIVIGGSACPPAMIERSSDTASRCCRPGA